MSLLPDTHLVQSQLATYCRTGKEIELAGVTPGRVHQYRRLVFNIINDNLESGFPIAFDFLETSVWETMVHEFFSAHACQSYQVWSLPKEFYEFVVENKYAERLNIPLVNDLLKFEWEEIEVYNMPDIKYPIFKQEGNIGNDILLFNPEFKIIPLSYPVHIQRPESAQNYKGNYFVLLYREKESGKVQFVDLSVWFALLIEQVHTKQLTVNELIKEAPGIFGEIDLKELKKNTLPFIKQMQKHNLILGFKP